MALMSDFDFIGNALYYFGSSFGLILIFETLVLYILETVFHYPSYTSQYGLWMGILAYFLALLSMFVLVHRDKKFMDGK